MLGGHVPGGGVERHGAVEGVQQARHLPHGAAYCARAQLARERQAAELGLLCK